MSDRLDRYARNQYGLITRSQAREVLTTRQIDGRTASGSWTVVRRGVYRLRSSPETWHSEVLATVIDRRALASHRTAATLFGLDRSRRRPPDFTVPYERRGRPVPGRHVTTQWDRRSEVVRHGIPCTGIDRTILDCAAVTPLRHVEKLAEAAIRLELTSWARLRSTLIVHSRRGRNGCGRFRSLLDMRAGTPGVTRSEFSLLVIDLLRDAGLPLPVVEYPIADQNGQHILSVDLAWPQWKKAWELDGLEWHFGRTDDERDRRKRNRLVGQGWVLQEVLWSMLSTPEDLVAMGRRFLVPPVASAA